MNNSIGVIGGADGPTSILISKGSPFSLPVIGVAIVIAVAIVMMLIYRKK